jgi:cytochrome c
LTWVNARSATFPQGKSVARKNEELDKKERTMIKARTTALLLTLIPAVPALAASSGEELAKGKHCLVCHDVKTQKFAPSFTDISHRFHGLNNAKPMLVRVVQTGTASPPTVFHWVNSTMPPESVRIPVSDAEAEQLVDYVLSLH